jgi:tetratricopeptide (TPR) repeat protein
MANKAKNKHKKRLNREKNKKQKANLRKKKSLRDSATIKRLSVSIQVEEVLDCIDHGDLSGAKTILAKLSKKHGNNPNVAYASGVLAVSLGQDNDVLHYFKKASALAPGMVEAQYNLAIYYKNNLMIPEMVSSLRKVIEVGDPEDEVVGESILILESLESQVLENDGISLDTYLDGARLFERALEYMNREEWGRSIDVFEDVLRINPNHVQSNGNIGICHAKVGNKKKALSYLDKALEIDPYYELAIINRKIIDKQSEGECLGGGQVKTIKYYKDYSVNEKSLIHEMLSSQQEETEVERFGVFDSLKKFFKIKYDVKVSLWRNSPLRARSRPFRWNYTEDIEI